MTRKTLLMLAVLTALSAGTAFAATAPASDSKNAPRAKLDTNGDGAIDRGEAAQHPRLAAKFDELDKNKDGKLAKEEMPRRHGRGFGKNGHGRHEMMTKLDTDKDGRISRAESAAGEGKLASRFDKMDVNKDGYIDRADRELRAKQRADEWFARADTDKDGKLSRAEVDASRSQRMEHRGMRGPIPADKPFN
ncbi:MAG: EF-hand domain-containing protein [Pseudoxanthomonas sp.]